MFFPQVLKHFAGRAFAHSSAFRSADCSAAALWLPPGIGPDEEALGAVMQEAVDPSRHQAVFSLLEQVGASHPDIPHWYLPAIGTDQNRQGQGLGSALLTASLPHCDARREAAYLEASNPRNIPFYERFGFKVCGEIQAGDSPVIYPMLRAASAVHAARELTTIVTRGGRGRARSRSRGDRSGAGLAAKQRSLAA